jgi:UDP-N-acetylmuramoyl-L-alanyl-D-glutamate--2,6-diaminopimelate ligase
MRLSSLIAGMPVVRVEGDTGVDITGITKDSRAVREGYLFFSTAKSAPYIAEAVKRGAKAIASEDNTLTPVACSIITPDINGLLGNVAARFYGMPSRDLFVAGITGTNGKTTTTYLMESMVREAGRNAGVIGTISYRYGGRTLAAPNTTPGSVEMHGLLKEMRDARTEFVAIEVSSHALDQKRVEGIDFDMGIFTNLTQDHLDYHGTMEEYKEAKRLLFTRYLEKSAKEKKWAVLNRDDPEVSAFVPGEAVTTLYYSVKGEADAELTHWQETIDGLILEISLMGQKMTVKSPLVGIFNASNILAACLFGYGAGLPPEAAVKGVEALTGVPGRLERITNERGISVFVDYAHTPDALKKVLELLTRLKKGRLIVVFGCGGDRDTTKRPLMGGIASHLADFSIVTSDNPRSEKPERIMDEIAKGFKGGPFRTIENRRDAIMEGIGMARPDDVVLIAGKGHEDYQIIGERTLHFSDREVAEEYFNVARG